MCGLSSDHDHYPYMYLVSVLFTSSCIIYSLTLHPIHFFNYFLLFFSSGYETQAQKGAVKFFLQDIAKIFRLALVQAKRS